MNNEITVYNKYGWNKELRESTFFELIRKDNLNEIETILIQAFASNENLYHLLNQQRICDGYTPLHCAVKYNNPYIILLLMSLGADPNIRAKNEKSAADLCNILPKRNKNVIKIIHSKDSEEEFSDIISIICSLKQKIGKKVGLELTEEEVDFIANNEKNSFNAYFDIDDISSDDYSSIIAVHRILNAYIQNKHYSYKKHSLLFNKFNQPNYIGSLEKNNEIDDEKVIDFDHLEHIEGLNLIGYQDSDEFSSDDEFTL